MIIMTHHMLEFIYIVESDNTYIISKKKDDFHTSLLVR